METIHAKFANTVNNIQSCGLTWKPKLILENVLLDTKNSKVRFEKLDMLEITSDLHESLQC